MSSWPEAGGISTQVFEDAKYRIEKDPKYFGYFIWSKGYNGGWHLVDQRFTWWGAKRLIKRLMRPTRPRKESKFWYF